MSLSRKHYRAIADAINESVRRAAPGRERNLLERCAWDISNYLASDNPRFDKYKFLFACLEVKNDQDR